MPVKVVDASALGAIAFGEPEGEAVAAMLSDSLLVAPLLLWFELSNICLKKIGKQPDQKDRLLKAFQLAQKLPIEMTAVDYHYSVISYRHVPKDCVCCNITGRFVGVTAQSIIHLSA